MLVSWKPSRCHKTATTGLKKIPACPNNQRNTHIEFLPKDSARTLRTRSTCSLTLNHKRRQTTHAHNTTRGRRSSGVFPIPFRCLLYGITATKKTEKAPDLYVACKAGLSQPEFSSRRSRQPEHKSRRVMYPPPRKILHPRTTSPKKWSEVVPEAKNTTHKQQSNAGIARTIRPARRQPSTTYWSRPASPKHQYRGGGSSSDSCGAPITRPRHRQSACTRGSCSSPRNGFQIFGPQRPSPYWHALVLLLQS